MKILCKYSENPMFVDLTLNTASKTIKLHCENSKKYNTRIYESPQCE